MATPEGRVKARVKALLARFATLYSYWPVPTGYGASGLDCYIAYNGRMVVVETKAPLKRKTPPTKKLTPSELDLRLTPRQLLSARELRYAGVRVFIIDGTPETDTIEELETYLNQIRDSRRPHPCPNCSDWLRAKASWS